MMRDTVHDELSLPVNAYDALARVAATRPHAAGLIFPGAGEQRTYSQWLDESQRLALALEKLGVVAGDRVGLWAENRVEWAITMAALAALGAVLVPINTHFREEDLEYVLTHSGAKVLLLSERYRNNAYLEMAERQRCHVPSLREIVCFDTVERPGVHAYKHLIATPANEFSTKPVGPEFLGSIQYTSGTTGRPKGAELTFRGMMLNAAITARRLQLGEADRWTSIIPLFHCAGCIMNLTGCLYAGAAYVGVPSFDAEAMFRIIESEKCTLLTGVPTSFLAMLQHPSRLQHDLSSLRAGTCGGADCDPAVLERCAVEFPIPGLVQVYGQTESSTLISLDSPSSDHRWETAGLPLDGTSIRVTHAETRVELAPGEIGQIEIKGPTVMRGYHQQLEETARTIDSEGWMQTGDLGYLRDDGRLVIAGGRLRDMIIRGGENIYPVEIENLLRQHPAVGEVAVFGEPDRYYGETVAACVQVTREVTAIELGEYLKGRIAGFKHPVRYYQIQSWPMTSSGKIRKRELREMAAAQKLELLA